MSAALQSPTFSVNVPIGSIIAWDGSLPGVPTLDQGWQLCDGALITDARSPMRGQNTRALNGNSDATKKFIRGSTTSGTTAGNATIGPGPAETGSAGGSNHFYLDGSYNIIPPSMEMIFIVRIF
jgi:hypothetical protein